MDSTPSVAEIYGRQHGTSFFFSGAAPAAFLAHMEQDMKPDIYDAYLTGFFAGLKGTFRRRYRYMKEPKRDKEE